MSDDNSKKTMLMEMGFDADRAQEALTVCDGNVERAIEYLFSGPSTDPPSGGTGTADSTSAATTTTGPSQYQDVIAPISQYSMDQGRSACTCIALTAAQNFLQRASQTTVITSSFLETAIRDGVATYQNLQAMSSSTGGDSQVEHMSAEDVLRLAASSGAGAGIFSNLQLTPGGIRQGILTGDGGGGDMGLQAMLAACWQDTTHEWLAVLITKTPETVLVLLPPASSSSTTGQYVVVDSHPRPGVVDSDGGAYARIVPSLPDVVAHLSTILPSTELGPDIPEMMQIMYNSFDLYPLVWNKN